MTDFSTKLVLITSNYPYGTGETFIENEINFLAHHFQEVKIIPINDRVKNKQRFLPDNVKVIDLKNNVEVSLVHVLFTIGFNKQILMEFMLNLLRNPLRNKVLIKSISNALTIRNILNLMIIQNKNTELYFYTYWLDDAAIALSLLKTSAMKVSRAHRWDIYQERHLYHYLPLRRHLAKNLDAIYSISENGQKELLKQTGQKNIFISRLGTINNYQFKIEPTLENTPLTIISIGNAIPIKRLHLIGESIQLINRSDCHWVHFGDGPLLSKIKKDYRFGDFRGQVSNTEIKKQLNNLKKNSILVNTSISEGIPVSMMEAMSFGIPCAGTNVGGVSEIIEDNINGFLLSPNPDKEEIANIIKGFTGKSKQTINEIKKAARKTWETKYNASTNYPDFIQLAFHKPSFRKID